MPKILINPEKEMKVFSKKDRDEAFVKSCVNALLETIYGVNIDEVDITYFAWKVQAFVPFVDAVNNRLTVHIYVESDLEDINCGFNEIYKQLAQFYPNKLGLKSFRINSEMRSKSMHISFKPMENNAVVLSNGNPPPAFV